MGVIPRCFLTGVINQRHNWEAPTLQWKIKKTWEVDGFFFNEIYPLVNIQKTMEITIFNR